MTLLRHRQRPVTAISKGKYRIPSRGHQRLGPKIYHVDGPDFERTIYGPSFTSAVSFSVEEGKTYRVSATVLGCSVVPYIPIPGVSEVFETGLGTFTGTPDDVPALYTYDVQPYGYGTMNQTIVATGDQLTLYITTADEAPSDPHFWITYGKFYAREVK